MKTRLIAPFLLLFASCSLVRQVTIKTNRGTITVDSAGRIGLSDAEIGKLADYFQLGGCTWMDSEKLIKVSLMSDRVKLAIIRELTDRLHLCDIGQWHSGGGIPRDSAFDALLAKVRHGKDAQMKEAAARQRMGVVTRQTAPDMSVQLTCQGGHARIEATAVREIKGDGQSASIWLRAPEAIAGSQLSGESQVVRNYHSDFGVQLVDLFGSDGITFFDAQEVNRIYGTDFKGPGSYANLIEGRMQPQMDLVPGIYVLAEWDGSEEMCGSLIIVTPESVPGPELITELGATTEMYLSVTKDGLPLNRIGN